MFVAHVRFPIAAEHRETVVEAFMADMDQVRAMKGCIAFFPCIDPSDETMFGVVHEWENEADFNSYGSSDAFKNFGAKIRPLMTGKPESRRFSAELKDVIT